MPQVTFRCSCGHVSDLSLPSSSIKQKPLCEICGSEMVRQFKIGNDIILNDNFKERRVGGAKIQREMTETKKRFEDFKHSLKNEEYK